MLVSEERGKPEYPEKNLSKQGREQTTNSTHIRRWVQHSNLGHIGGRRALSPLHHPCSSENTTSKKTISVKRECPGRPREITKMWHMLEKLISLIFCSEIPHDELINVVYLFYSDLLLFSKKNGKMYMLPTATKWWTSKGRVSTQELRY